MKQPEVIIQTDDVKVRVMPLSPGEITPMHYHSVVTDNIFCLSGLISIRLKDGGKEVVLRPGERFEIKPGVLHEVINSDKNQAAEYLLVQGVGPYDFLTDK